MNADAHGDERVESAAERPVRRPRNYLASGERRRIFWRLMPPAVAAVLLIGWLERLWNPPAGDATSARIDTRLAADPRTTLGPGDVLVEQSRPLEPSGQFVPSLSAPSDSLAVVKDEAFFRSEEQPAWIQTFLTLRSTDGASLRAAAKPVAFGELFGQPHSFRGRPVRFSGKVRSLQRRTAPANDYGIGGYHEAWVEPADGSSSPIVVHSLELPADLDVNTAVDVEGYFFKNLAYLARDHQLRRAPLVLAATLHIRPPPPPTAVAYHGGWMLGYSLLAVVVATVAIVMGFGLGLVGPVDVRRPVGDAADLEATLAGADVVSPAEALRRLEAVHRAADEERSAEAMPPS